jgi:ABC-type lipoprotein export system ATPase subunit
VSAGAEIHVEAVSMRYSTPSGLVRALDGVTLDVAPGASLAVTGPSGCGKSTLLGLIGGLDAPTEGRVLLGDLEMSSLPEQLRAGQRRSHIGFVFQADNLLPFLTVVENVALQLSLDGRERDYSRCLDLLGELGLAEQADKLPDQLSGGQRQRVAVACAIVHRPGLVLADEPTGALDSASSAAVVDLLLTTRAEMGATLVVVTHDPGVARRLDRTVELRDGRLVGDVVGGRAA